MKSIYWEFYKEDLIGSSRSVCAWIISLFRYVASHCIGKGQKWTFSCNILTFFAGGTASPLICRSINIPLVQCFDMVVNMSGLILSLSLMKVTNFQKRKLGKKIGFVNHYRKPHWKKYWRAKLMIVTRKARSLEKS